jgi:AcrR family transcriptional regulator
MSDHDTKKKIVEASTYLFGVKGYDGTSTREIAQRAGVNLASLNYHFKSKQGLLKEVTAAVIEEFKENINAILISDLSASEFAVKVFETLTADSSKFLNHFKLFLDAEQQCGELEPQPIGHEQLSKLLKKEISHSVPDAEIRWASHIIFNYIMHTSVMSATEVGKRHIEKFLPNKKDSIPAYIRQLVETLSRDLNFRYK